MKGLDISLKLPDIWQQESVQHLQEGRDLVVHAPTGAGKTFIFELFVARGFQGQLIYTVPTRALANDKLFEWMGQGWNVGLATGDLAFNLNAPILVATLETQKQALIRGDGPTLLVIDEYQMLSDPQRGLNYELSLALAPSDTQFLLMSGSVANPMRMVEWLRRLGREAMLVSHDERPVPLEEIRLEGIHDRVPASIRGYWPRNIAKALAAELGPMLVFAPKRRLSESLAKQLSAALPNEDPLILTPEQKQLAGDKLARLIKNRVAFHHSGLSYAQRAGLVEPLAKAGQLRVVVSTTGLAAGINFSMRSVLITDRTYRAGPRDVDLRPDELLQMFGRAGRRGLDDKGYVVTTQETPTLNEARPGKLKRTDKLDWPACIAVLDKAAMVGEDPNDALDAFLSRLFSQDIPNIGLHEALRQTAPKVKLPKIGQSVQKQSITEMMNSEGQWERLRAPREAQLGNALLYFNKRWYPALKLPKTLERIPVGYLCKLGKGEQKRYGRQMAVATFPKEEGVHTLELTKPFEKSLREFYNTNNLNKRPRKKWTIEQAENELSSLMPYLTGGGSVMEWIENSGTLQVKLDYSGANVMARPDSEGCALINPPQRKIEVDAATAFAQLTEAADGGANQSPADWWLRLGLIDEQGVPTQRGKLFSFFNNGEGLAIAAALEDETYPLDELIVDLANLRAGYRFEDYEGRGARLGALCRLTYNGATCAGYLERGVPPEYGEGAAQVLANLVESTSRMREYINDELRDGDIERARLEWFSLMRQIRFAPPLDWDRYLDLQSLCAQWLGDEDRRRTPPTLPQLTPQQKTRYDVPLRLS